ncbi:Calmodulin-regulated spectrin-associated 1-B [Gossypium arboreum]|uniref:Calmodulin-regulated spectrin-associated 1-B n=1 Tax=Gossypium arboreum TaxID=29729 RepID=A0A0B0PS37_GOSAR|nr:Calmodulin-regulated spectrin-associated 1-B [Gossypium arboreum]
MLMNASWPNTSQSCPFQLQSWLNKKENSKSYSRVDNPSLHASSSSFTLSMQWLYHHIHLGRISFP